MTNLSVASRVRADGVREVSPDDVHAARGSVTLIDVREPHEFTGELGHIPGAKLVPLGTVEEAATAWPKEDEIVVVCRSGARSGRATALLSSMGFARVYNMAGGMLAYGEQKLPVER
jgi:rhodanese-related sulfurtransferase